MDCFSRVEKLPVILYLEVSICGFLISARIMRRNGIWPQCQPWTRWEAMESLNLPDVKHDTNYKWVELSRPLGSKPQCAMIWTRF